MYSKKEVEDIFNENKKLFGHDDYMIKDKCVEIFGEKIVKRADDQQEYLRVRNNFTPIYRDEFYLGVNFCVYVYTLKAVEIMATYANMCELKREYKKERKNE